MTRNGKIARLPQPIREQINRRLQDGQEGKRIVAWLNTLPEVAAVMGRGLTASPSTNQTSRIGGSAVTRIGKPAKTRWKLSAGSARTPPKSAGRRLDPNLVRRRQTPNSPIQRPFAWPSASPSPCNAPLSPRRFPQRNHRQNRKGVEPVLIVGAGPEQSSTVSN